MRSIPMSYRPKHDTIHDQTRAGSFKSEMNLDSTKHEFAETRHPDLGLRCGLPQLILYVKAETLIRNCSGENIDGGTALECRVVVPIVVWVSVLLTHEFSSWSLLIVHGYIRRKRVF